MGRSATGVLTRPGILTQMLLDLDLQRSELAELLQVSVRTIHNIEYGRKPVNREVLDRLAVIVSQRWSQKYGSDQPKVLTADSFITEPDSVAAALLQYLGVRESDVLLVGENVAASTVSQPGTSGGKSPVDFGEVLSRMHQGFELSEMKEVQMLRDPNEQVVIVSSVMTAIHPRNRRELDFKAFLEIRMDGNQIISLESVYDTQLLATFMRTGQIPRSSRRSV